jgi:hypothetical protein
VVKTKKQQFGHLPPQYNFSVNPYPDMRFSSCPDCGRKTGQRKLPLLIHIDPIHLIALNYTCRYCRHCDMLIGHKDELEHLLTNMFAQYDPSVIGNDYLIVGTVEKKAWREGLTQPKSVADLLPHAHDFKSYQEIRMTMGGWFHVDQEPPVMPPPPSTEWVKRRSGKK